jgi:5-aminolevulinate synthase
VRSFAPSFIFSTALPPAVCAAAAQSVRIAKSRPELRMAHQRQAWLTKHALMQAGLPVLPNMSHIVPLMVGDAQLCKAASDMLLERHGIYIQPINYPTVARGTERLRITPTPAHGDAHIAHLVEALVDVWSTLRIPFVQSSDVEAPFANDAHCTYPAMKRAAE